ncbi:MAG: BatA domain-containing protein [Bacteroidia bacterium]
MIQFLYPAFLFALFAIAIPIIIHLFNFRRFKRVYFTNVQFLKEVKQETQSKSRLKHLLVLISRILAIIFLVLAFAQPFIPVDDRQVAVGAKNISVFIDNSFSMEAVGPNGRLLDVAKRKAEDLALAYDPSDRFQLLTNNFEARHQRMVTRDEFITMISEVNAGPAAHNISEVVKRQKDALGTASNQTAFLLSDFQKSITDINAIETDTNLSLRYIPVNAQKTGNLYIDSVWFSSPGVQPGRPEELHVKIMNTGDEEAENIPVKFTVNGAQRALASVDIAANTSVTSVLSFSVSEPGWQKAVLSITDYPITFDDNYYIAFNVASQINVLSLNEETSNNYLEALFRNDPFFQYLPVNINQVDYSGLKNYNLIVLNDVKTVSSGLSQELNKFVEDGGTLLVFPADQADLNSFQNMLSTMEAGFYSRPDTQATRVDRINLESEIFRDVFEKVPDNMDMPLVRKHYTLNRGSRTSEEVLLRLQNGNSLLSRYNHGRGTVYVSTVSLSTEFSNFPRHAIFVPALYKIALLSSRNERLAYTIGTDQAVEHREASISSDQVLHLVNKENGFDIIPEHRSVSGKTTFFMHDQVREAGIYDLVRGNETVAVFAFNYNRNESQLDFYTPDQLAEMNDRFGLLNVALIRDSGRNLASIISDTSKGISLWKWCIVLVLIFLGIETLLLKFWK